MRMVYLLLHEGINQYVQKRFPSMENLLNMIYLPLHKEINRHMQYHFPSMENVEKMSMSLELSNCPYYAPTHEPPNR